MGTGVVDLRSEALAIAFAAKAPGAVLGPTRVGGTLAAPVVGGEAAAGDPAIEIVAADDHPCQTALGQPASRKALKRRAPANASLGR